MCRNIHTLHNYEPPATEEEIRASALQYVRKISGSTKPSKANEARSSKPSTRWLRRPRGCSRRSSRRRRHAIGRSKPRKPGPERKRGSAPSARRRRPSATALRRSMTGALRAVLDSTPNTWSTRVDLGVVAVGASDDGVLDPVPGAERVAAHAAVQDVLAGPPINTSLPASPLSLSEPASSVQRVVPVPPVMKSSPASPFDVVTRSADDAGSAVGGHLVPGLRREHRHPPPSRVSLPGPPPNRCHRRLPPKTVSSSAPPVNVQSPERRSPSSPGPP